ncbi:hypothetical protein CEXT_343251 [Caerostris extrusa]|uniref:Uncharacterized protein n=1 Tax=Caerostris extrusa TaxID=172846 RepID=A0AAV4VGN2_CAEEX|nr:hypothetical protein CEXT_343251 [Caerostris extrusa]
MDEKNLSSAARFPLWVTSIVFERTFTAFHLVLIYSHRRESNEIYKPGRKKKRHLSNPHLCAFPPFVVRPAFTQQFSSRRSRICLQIERYGLEPVFAL